jgi:hypothetical protein
MACGESSRPGVDQAGGGRAGVTYVQQYADAKTAVVGVILARARGGGMP